MDESFLELESGLTSVIVSDRIRFFSKISLIRAANLIDWFMASRTAWSLWIAAIAACFWFPSQEALCDPIKPACLKWEGNFVSRNWSNWKDKELFNLSKNDRPFSFPYPFDKISSLKCWASESSSSILCKKDSRITWPKSKRCHSKVSLELDSWRKAPRRLESVQEPLRCMGT